MPPARILVVDDEEALRDMVQNLLEREGHTVTLACDGHEALAKYLDETFDIVLTDVKMPGMDGSIFYERAVAIKPQLASQCIVVTGDTITKDTDHFLKRTGLPLVHKPFSKAMLLEAIRKVQQANAAPEDKADPPGPDLAVRAEGDAKVRFAVGMRAERKESQG